MQSKTSYLLYGDHGHKLTVKVCELFLKRTQCVPFKELTNNAKRNHRCVTYSHHGNRLTAKIGNYAIHLERDTGEYLSEESQGM